MIDHYYSHVGRGWDQYTPVLSDRYGSEHPCEVLQGDYMWLGRLVVVAVRMRVQRPGCLVTWLSVSLPVQHIPAAADVVIGSCLVHDISADSYHPLLVHGDGRLSANGAASNCVVGPDDEIKFFVQYAANTSAVPA